MKTIIGLLCVALAGCGIEAVEDEELATTEQALSCGPSCVVNPRDPLDWVQNSVENHQGAGWYACPPAQQLGWVTVKLQSCGYGACTTVSSKSWWATCNDLPHGITTNVYAAPWVSGDCYRSLVVWGAFQQAGNMVCT